MKYDIVLAGVGGQGILSIAATIARTALDGGLRVKQSEVHGMSQRGGAVLAHLRLSQDTIHSDLVPRGAADLVLSLELMEGLRYLEYLKPAGRLLTATTCVRNIPDYPPQAELAARIRSSMDALLVDADGLARQAGSPQAANMVMVGAASHLLPLTPEHLLQQIAAMFARKGEKVVEINRRAFQLGREAVECAPA